MKKKNKEEKVCTLKKEYERMKQERQPFLDKALEAARYTIPSLIKEVTNSKYDIKTIVTPNQSVGADGVNSLASKICLTLIPPNQTFYKFEADPVELKKDANLKGVEYSKYEADVVRGLSLIEDMLLKYQSKFADRIVFGEMCKHLLVAGNVLGVFDKDEGLYYYPLSRYCVKRDYTGNVLKVITEESTSVLALPEGVRELVIKKIFENENIKEVPDYNLEDKEVTIYTVYKRKDNSWVSYQEVEGVYIEDSYSKLPIDTPQFFPLRYTRIDGESYGRGLIEEYIGDLSYLDTLELAIKEASLAGAKVIPLVNPAGMTKIKDIAEAPNGKPVLGRIDDVQFLQVQKYNDLSVASQEADKIEKRLNRIFVMKAAIQRQAERVTAEEIRQMAQDLDETLGNQYSIMCKEFQEAYVKITFFYMKKEKKGNLPDLISTDLVNLTITTGLEALGRSSDLNKLSTFLQIMGELAPAIGQLNMKVRNVADAVAASLNLNVENYFYTEEEMAQMQQQAQQQSLAEKTAPGLVKSAGDMMMKQQEQEGMDNDNTA